MAASETEDSDILWCINHDSFPFKKPLMEAQVGAEETYIEGVKKHASLSSDMISNFCVTLQMMSNVDGHSWTLCAINEERQDRITTPLNKDLIPITDSPVVVQQHNIPSQKFVLLSAKVKVSDAFSL